MRTVTKIATAMLSALATLAVSFPAQATNGYFTHGVGAKSKGMAGTGIGSDDNMGPNSVASNPALGVFVDRTWEVGLSAFSPRRTYVASTSQANGQGGAFTVGAGEIESSSEWFPIPYVARNWKLSDDRAFTLMFYGRGGMNTDWDSPSASATSLACDPAGASVVTGPGPFCSGEAGVDLSQAFLAINYAGKFSENLAWGIGPVFAVQAFEAKGIASFTPFTKTFASSIVGGGGPVPAPALTNNGHDYSVGWGFAGGLWWGLSDSVSAGLAYQSKMSMSEFDDYADLFAESGGFDIPSSVKFGLSFKASEDLRLNFDIEHTQFSEVDAVGNPMANIAGCPTAGLGGTDLESCLGGARGAGFGWDDMTTYKIGAHWQMNNEWSWHFGYSTTEQPISGADVLFNILAPGVVEQHFTVGTTRLLPDGKDWTLSIMFAPEKSVVGTNMFDPTQTIELKMNQFEVEFSYSW